METPSKNTELIDFFVNSLLSWYYQNGRSFPWRETKDPYQILVAELMLQRTKASQVVPVYLEFIKEFPDVFSLSRASPERIRDYFSRLGLEWRAEKVLTLAKILVEKYGGRIPCDKEKLLSLPGVGEYISAAVLSFACNVPVAVVDSNVVRILSRYFGITPRGEGRRDKKILELASKILPEQFHREYNFAIIDLAALVCTPRKPKCEMCPLREKCSWVQKNKKD
ncbi:MAG: A/G-specific adenine glycosylase [Thermococcaceae archaeon]|nr:MAG: Uncharacterized protein XD43_0379 [Thermococcales archaeon 44_46]MDK2853182.1 A/G-specific adenine glycosylase [Thermococcaceae archaeon]MDN5319712.1 A/G-specific adenine glycosylase [Thermococcaceae archaeon]HIH73523.1 A/G-specific adenine glycosylase [Thermococcaceae archaeon]